jgi:N-acetylglutamate synthase-like GNAT family acetyltransferase
MLIRNATIEDIPHIIPLLKTSLGESLMPKSEVFFRWKHVDNPFGASKIIIAEEDGKLIGIRAFMFWKWIAGEKQRTAVRAVDTATDPAHQGKGIFTRLTMQAVQECTADGVDFVFNTPNPISKIGYLKMGWYENGKLPLLIKPAFCIPLRMNAEASNTLLNDYDAAKALQSLSSSWQIISTTKKFQTPLHYAYLQWRYAECPVARYGALIEPGQFGCIFRLKPLRGFIECRICELWTESDEYVSTANQAISKLIKKIRPLLVTCAPSAWFAQGTEDLKGMWGPYKVGPMVTLRNLQEQSLPEFDGFAQWQPSLGSMELF